MEADAAWFLRGVRSHQLKQLNIADISKANISTASNPAPASQRRKLIQYAVLIEHPKEGLILWECGSGENWPEVVGAPLNDIFARVDYKPEYELQAQVEATGHKIEDIKMVSTQKPSDGWLELKIIR